VFALAFGAVLIFDQLAKALVGRVPRAVLSAGPMRLRHVENRRFAGNRRLVAACWLPMVAGGMIIASTVFAASPSGQVGLGLAMGGATGNAVDLFRGRPVLDFVDLRIWPVFNLADAAITCGFMLTLWSVR
jgi:lipoprotein signal peptidase